MRTLLLAGILSAACASTNAGAVAIKPFGAAGAPAANFTVGNGHISGQLIDAYVSNGCLRGTMGRLPLDLCDQGDGHWAGSSGDVTLKMLPDGKAVAVGGYLQLDTRRQLSVDGERLDLGQGEQWEELRKNPVLLVVASAAADLHGGGLMRRPGY